MRGHLLLIPLALVAAPAVAQTAPAAEQIVVPPELNDPAMTDKLVDVMQALSKAFLNLPVGEVEAAIEGRRATSADKRRTVRSESGMSEQQMKAHIEQSRPMMHAGMKAMMAALPAMMKGMSEAGKELEKATSNLPQPGYPKR